MNTISRVTCLSCDWTTDKAEELESANYYGECISCKDETPMKWHYIDGTEVTLGEEGN